MKIKTQILLLLAGLIIIPIVLLTSYWLMFHQRQILSDNVPTYEEIFSERPQVTTEEDWERIRSFIARRSPAMDVTVFDRASMEVLYSTMDQFKRGQVMDEDDLMEYALENSDRYFFQMTAPPHLKNSSLITFIRSQKTMRPPHSRLEHYVNTVTIISTIILLFCIVIITTITRSIAKSVTVLKNAAERVTMGEFDTPIEVHGSNEIISLTKSLNELRLAVKENRDRQARFIMGVSHDLKTPLALIRGYVEALYDEIPSNPEERQQYAQIILKKADDLEALINDLIDVIKVETGEWRSCFENLFSNAIRYSHDDGTIKLRAFQSYSGVKSCFIVQIADNGIGIAKEELKNIFEMFYRGTGSRREMGHGLGLAIVKSIIQSHNWEIEAESDAGKGTVFTITIPA